jgi:RimJ/RimL family protein N-acetyltransferase
MLQWLEEYSRSADPCHFTVVDESSKAVGMAAFMRMVPRNGCLELGHIWYSPAQQRTRVNTETIYLMLKEAFENLGNRRVEWKCDSLNRRSRIAALRLGFRFEGIFRQHMIIKGRNRDTAWFAMTDGDWGFVKKNIERWLFSEDELSLTSLMQHRE